MSKIATVIRYKTNPFVKDLVIKRKTKNIKISALGSDNNIVINQTTGEVKGTHISTYRQVDEAKFVKLFSQNIALTFDLTSAGIKAFNVLIFAVQFNALNKDLVQLDSNTLSDFIAQNTSINLSNATFNRGLRELVKAKIIAPYSSRGFYFINPSFCFNGDRLAFTTVIERKNRAELDKLEHDFELEKEEEKVF